ncbi:MAG: UDP-N-acetylglucosamine diphosphorylase/glucosamine-1-phosphate N-acetyltransferase [Gammaproteobacteria bacterium]|nr:MAG: UDP-N-acetylglucosamine diphosphorylase/glucosamine-1-phosphate N-acetyltransferase [Gammaproteobacteria bacterium]
MTLTTLILAAGQGTRMRSSLPKVLHRLAGRPLLEHVCRAAMELGDPRLLIVHGHGGERVREALAQVPARWIEQAEQLGTGHAVEQALPLIPDGDLVLILYGDVPLIGTATLRRLVEAGRATGFGLLTVELEEPRGYGRILRDEHGRVTGIVEEKDADEAQRAIREINTGFMAVRAGLLRKWIGRLENDNAQGEFYLTDVVAMAAQEGIEVRTVRPDDPFEVMGVNDRIQLAALERHCQRRKAEALMRQGVTLLDPARFDLRGSLEAGRDVEIDVDVVVEGAVRIGEGSRIGPGCVIRDAVIGEGVEVLAHCVIEGAEIGTGSRIGPFARLRPGTSLAGGTHIGNFVEVKNSTIGEGSKVNHLSYIGDTDIGTGVNVGAGTITCNYDGARKHRTVIEDDAFIGSDTQLVAPVRVGRGATIGAGTTLTRDAPDDVLTLSRAPQKSVPGWRRPRKEES